MKLRRFPLWPADSVPVVAHESGAWLYAVDGGVDAIDLAEQLGIEGGQVFEVSALEWIDDAAALRDLIRVIGGPNVYAENWDALRDGLADLPRPCLIIVRDIDPRHERSLGSLVAIFDPTRRAGAGGQFLALEGWRHSNVEDATPTAWRADVYELTTISSTPAPESVDG